VAIIDEARRPIAQAAGRRPNLSRGVKSAPRRYALRMRSIFHLAFKARDLDEVKGFRSLDAVYAT
jgi:hypothetical protein